MQRPNATSALASQDAIACDDCNEFSGFCRPIPWNTFRPGLLLAIRPGFLQNDSATQIRRLETSSGQRDCLLRANFLLNQNAERSEL